MPQPMMGYSPQPAPQPLTNATRVFSIVDGREVARLPAVLPAMNQSPRVWFVGPSIVVSAGRDETGPTVVVRELKLVLPPKTFTIDAMQVAAVSPGGKYMASWVAGKLNLYSLDDGSIVGEAKFPRRVSFVRALAFSPDGTSLAAVTDEGMTGWHLIDWSMSNGEVQSDAQIVPPRITQWNNDNFQFLGDSRGVLMGDDLVDLGSGKVFYSIQHPTAGTAVGQVVRVNWPDAVLFEYAVLGNMPKVIYKTDALPKGQLEIALKALRPATTMPSEAPNATAAASTKAPTTAPAAPANATSAAPTTQQIPLTTLVRQNNWTVTVVAVVADDPANYDQTNQTLQAKIAEVDTRLTTAKRELQTVSSQFTTQNYTDAFGMQHQRNVYNDAGISVASSNVRRIEEEERGYKQELAKNQRDQTTAKFKRTITARLPDETLCQIDIDTQALAVVADTMTPSTTHTIAGTARIVDQLLHIKPRTMAPVK
jgi:hypothetical protein